MHTYRQQSLILRAGLIILYSALLSGCGGGGGGGGAVNGNLTLIGSVLLVDTNLAPNPAATITIAGHTATTSASGGFVLTNIPASATTGTVSAAAEQTLTLTLALPATSTQAINLGTIYLSSVGYTASASGQVATTVSGQNQAVGGATVTIAGSSALTATDGTFNISNLPVGLGSDPNTPIGSVTASNFVTKQIFVQAPLITGSNPLGTILLGAPISGTLPGLPYTIIGQVLKGGVGQSGYPVALSQGSAVLGTVTTDNTGTFSFWVVPGTYLLTVGLPSGSFVTQSVTLASANQPVTQNVIVP